MGQFPAWQCRLQSKGLAKLSLTRAERAAWAVAWQKLARDGL
jgi:hypothetical protein